MAILDELVGILGFDFQGRADAQRYQQTLGRVDKQLDGVGKRALGFGRLITGAIAALGAARVINSAVSFEEAMADINKVVDATPDQIAELSDEFLKMSRELPVSAEGLAAIAAEAGAAGVAFEDLPGFARQVAIAVTAFDLPAEQVGETMSKLANVFRFNIEEIGHFNDTVNHLSNNMAAKAGELLNFTNRAAGAASLLGLTADQLAGVGAALIAAGVVPETAARGLNAFATRVQTDATGVSDALALIGLTTTQLQDKLAADGDAALLEVFESLAELDVSKQAGALKALVGQDFSDDFAKFLANPDLLAQGFALANDEAGKLGSAQGEFEARAATTAAKWQRIKNILASAGIIVAGPLLDGFKRVADFIFKIVEAFDSAEGAAASVAAALQAMGLNVNAEQVTAFAVEVMNILAELRHVVEDAFAIMRQRIEEFVNSAAFQGIVESIAGSIERFREIWAKFQEVLSSEGGQELIRVLKEIGDALFQLGASVVGQGLAAALDLLSTAVLGLLTAFGQLINGDFAGAFDTLIETFQNLLSIIGETIAKFAEFAAQFATDLGESIGDGIKAGVDAAVAFAKQKLADLVQGIKNAFASLNPFGDGGNAPIPDVASTDFRNIRTGQGAATGEGFREAFAESRPPVSDEQMAQNLQELSDFFQNQVTPAADQLATAAAVAGNIETDAPDLVEQTLNTDNTKNITNQVTNNTTVNQTVTGATAPQAAANATQGAAQRGTDRALTVNNSGADS